MNLFITGLADMDLQQDIMSEKDITLDRAVSMAEARETAKRCQETMESDQHTAALSTYKKDLLKPKISADQCRCCGEKRHKDKSDCPAIDNECSCGRKGHYKRFCFSGGKKKIRKDKQEREEAKKKDETGNVIEAMFGIKED